MNDEPVRLHSDQRWDNGLSPTPAKADHEPPSWAVTIFAWTIATVLIVACLMFITALAVGGARRLWEWAL